MARIITLSSINFIKATNKVSGTRGIGYAAAMSKQQNDVVECIEGMKKTRNIEKCEWVPHPRSGIYFPKGHDWVLEDVTHSPASLTPSFWIRNVDGVDHRHLDHF